MADGRNYERKGDPFTRLVLSGKGPPTVIHWRKQTTGRYYCTRVPVDRCYFLKVSNVLSAVRGVGEHLPSLQGMALPQLARLLVLDWHPEGQRIKVNQRHNLKERAAGVRLGLQVTPTGPGGAGVRLWFSCPRCARRCRVLYGSPWNARGARIPGEVVTGCRVCLGLTDESQQTHKCLQWASAVLGERPYSPDLTGRYRRRGVRSEARANAVFVASFGRAFRGIGIPMPSQE